ncbi:MAG: exodeoxyribonuclease VII small subunit [Bacteriovoracaceae bacterium]
MATKKADQETQDFESGLKELEKLVNDLESGELPLQDSLQKFERGVELYKNCRVTLDQAEKKIKILSDSLKELDYQ